VAVACTTLYDYTATHFSAVRGELSFTSKCNSLKNTDSVSSEIEATSILVSYFKDKE